LLAGKGNDLAAHPKYQALVGLRRQRRISPSLEGRVEQHKARYAVGGETGCDELVAPGLRRQRRISPSLEGRVEQHKARYAVGGETGCDELVAPLLSFMRLSILRPETEERESERNPSVWSRYD